MIMSERDLSEVDIKDAEAVKEASREIIEEIWNEHFNGSPIAIMVNVSAYLNAQMLSQFQDPGQLLYALDKNAEIMEEVLDSLARTVGRDVMEKAMLESGFREVMDVEEDEERGALH
jgi:hypothetical protein